MPPSNRIVIEACVGSLEDAIAAAELGADRLEFCSALEVGGLTPDFRQLDRLRKLVDLPIMAMIRSRAGDFHYSTAEWHRMLAEARRALELGADGVVFGALTEDRRIDCDRTASMIEYVRYSGVAQVVFHKAFDETLNLSRSWQELKSLGVDRVLTSGGAATALEGADELKTLVNNGGPAVLIGGGVRAANVLEILRRTDANEIHAACRSSGSHTPGLDRDAFSALVETTRMNEELS